MKRNSDDSSITSDWACLPEDEVDPVLSSRCFQWILSGIMSVGIFGALIGLLIGYVVKVTGEQVLCMILAEYFANFNAFLNWQVQIKFESSIRLIPLYFLVVNAQSLETTVLLDPLLSAAKINISMSSTDIPAISKVRTMAYSDFKRYTQP
jgi:hypothetical protein